MELIAKKMDHLGARARQFWMMIGELYYLSKTALISIFTPPIYWTKVLDQIVVLGIGSVSIAIVIGITMGSVMTLNFGYGLAKFGGTLYVPKIVAVSLTREMAPIFTSLLVAGRVGSGIAAEIGSMNVTQQIDALRALGTSPIRIIVVPRLLALIIALPLLTTLSDILGIVGSLLIAVSEFDMTTSYFMNTILSTVKPHDFYSGLIKTVFFAFIIVIVGCYRGFKTSDGTRGVGKSTTWVVVTSSILILLSNFIMSKLIIVFWIT